MTHINRFEGKGEIYAKSRPKYAAELLDYLEDTLRIHKGVIFADIGSGTGIFTEQLLNCGYKVFAVEPNADMRKKAEDRLSAFKDFISVDGTDRNSNLPGESVDFITAAQAFHWFDAEAFKTECKRILKPNGKVIIVYNSRDENAECTRALAELRYKYNSEFCGFSNGISDKKCQAFFTGGCKIFKADNSQCYDRQGYINRVLSSSYSLKEGDERYTEYLKEINKLFDMFSIDGLVTVPLNTVAYVGEV